jgi:hypothetical protein
MFISWCFYGLFSVLFILFSVRAVTILIFVWNKYEDALFLWISLRVWLFIGLLDCCDFWISPRYTCSRFANEIRQCSRPEKPTKELKATTTMGMRTRIVARKKTMGRTKIRTGTAKREDE